MRSYISWAACALQMRPCMPKCTAPRHALPSLHHAFHCAVAATLHLPPLHWQALEMQMYEDLRSVTEYFGEE